MDDVQRKSLQQHILELLALCDLPEKELIPLCVIAEDLYQTYSKGENK